MRSDGDRGDGSCAVWVVPGQAWDGGWSPGFDFPTAEAVGHPAVGDPHRLETGGTLGSVAHWDRWHTGNWVRGDLE